jgi:hypothetical protein
VIEAGRTNPKVIALIRRAQDERVLLRMTAIELRRIAEEAPDLAAELRDMAQKLETEAQHLARRGNA